MAARGEDYILLRDWDFFKQLLASSPFVLLQEVDVEVPSGLDPQGRRLGKDPYERSSPTCHSRWLVVLTKAREGSYLYRHRYRYERTPFVQPAIMKSEETNAAPLELQAFDLLAAGNVSAAVAALAAIADTQIALEGLARLCQRAYRDLKSVSAMTAIAWAAVEFGQRCATASPDSESANRYKARVRALAYNAAANCWPGWGDLVEINSADIAEGLKLAERNYALVEELGLAGKQIGGALWLIGALQMAIGQLSAATAQFQRAEETFDAAHLPVYAAMARGYAALANKALPGSHLRGSESLAAILLSLRALESREAQFFADQLATADRIFSFL